MKHAFRKVLCLLLVLTMLIGILPTGMFAFAASVAVGDGNVLVDDDFAAAANNETVTTTVGDTVYQAVKGVNAFDTINEALSKVADGGAVYVGAGRYEGGLTVTANVALYGAGMNINPNTDDWKLNSRRSDLSAESVIVGQIQVTTKALTKFVVNGFTFTGQSSIREATSGSTIKGVDLCYNRFVNMIDISSTTGAFYFTGTTVRTGRISYNRVEDAQSAKPVTFRNADNFTFSYNYMNFPGVGIWLTAEIADQNVTPGKMLATVVGNYLIGNSPIEIYAAYADAMDVTVSDNIFEGKRRAMYIAAQENSTLNKNIKILNNTLSATTSGIDFVAQSGVPSFNPDLVVIRGNNFNNGTIVNAFTSSTPLNLSYNYFASGPSYTGSPSPIVYPRYTNAEHTTLIGDMRLESVSLTGVMADGTREDISGIAVDNDNNTVTLKDTVDSVYTSFEVAATANSGTSVKFYSDSVCKNELTGGNVVDYLKKGANNVFIKLITSLDNYSYQIYSMTINRAASHESKINGVKDFDHSINGQDVSITLPSAEVNPNIQLETSMGATYALYKDAACTQKINGTVINGVPAGSSTYYVKVTAEDGVTTSVYRLLVTRAPSSAVEILEVKSPQFVTYDKTEDAYIGVYSSKYETLSLDLTVSEYATWKFYSDAACTTEADAAKIALNVGTDNVYYVKVTSEGGAKEKVYKFIFRSESADASKEIYGVLGNVISSSVERDTISIELKRDVKTYTPSFDYAGAYWKMYTDYEDGVLGGAVSENTIENLTGGNHVYYVAVYAADASYRVYTLKINRRFETASKLTGIGGGMSFYIDRFDFTAVTTVQDEGAFMPTFTASVGATVEVKTVGGVAVSLPLTLRPGNNEYTIVVTAEDGVSRTSYAWTITCIGEGYPVLDSGVAVSTAWDGLAVGTPVYPVISGKVYKAYVGETAFATIAAANRVVSSYNNTIYVMSGTVINENITVTSINLYGANFNVNPNTTNRYTESVIKGKVTLAGTGASVNGFKVAEEGSIVVNGSNNNSVVYNLFADDAARTEPMISAVKSGAKYNGLVISDNRFVGNSSATLISVASVAGLKISENRMENTADGALITIGTTENSASITVSDNNFAAGEQAIVLSDVTRAGMLLVEENDFVTVHALSFAALKADDAFTLSFYNNKANTTDTAVLVSGAKRALATRFYANENQFTAIDRAVSFEYDSSTDTVGVSPVDITANYYGVATPGNDAFDSNYCYKPYYVDAKKENLSNVIHGVDITVNGKAITDNGINKYAVVVQNAATVKAAFAAQTALPAAALGTVYVNAAQNIYVSDEADITVNDRTPAYVTVLSLDQTEKKTEIITLHPQSLNPVYDVYDVENCTISGLTVRVLVGHNATAWTPSLEIEDNKAIAFYSDSACTKKLSGAIALSGDCTKVYGKVEGFDTVVFEVYKSLSSDKAILGLKQAYSFAYTGKNSIAVEVDKRLATADMSASVSEGATYRVYRDADCLSEVDDYNALTQAVTKLYYKVTAADASSRVIEVTFTWIDVTDPTILSIKNANVTQNKNGSITAKISSYKAKEGFLVDCVLPAGCTVKLYADEAHNYVLKNNTVFFSANYVYFYATVTSPDGQKSAEYKIRLEKPVSKAVFADSIPGWAKSAVREVKDLGIVNGNKTNKGLMLEPNGKATREMIACFMVRMLGIDETQYAAIDLTAYYDDADQVSAWAQNAVKAATALGIFSGSKSGDQILINAKNNITRQEFAVVFVRTIKAEKTNVSSFALNYKDTASIASWAKPSVKIMTKLGYMQGDGGYFRPTNSISRIEIIQTIANYL